MPLNRHPAPTIYQLREALRQRLTRHLPERSIPMAPSGDTVLSDEAMLRLLSGATLHHEGDLSVFEAAYQAAQTKTSLPFKQVIAGGWIRIIGSRVWASSSLARSIEDSTDPALATLGSVIRTRYKMTWSFDPALKNDPALSEVIDGLEGGALSLRDLRCQRPEWVAARLWEIASGPDRLEQWRDRWRVLQAPEVIPHLCWNSADAETFRDLARAYLAQATAADWPTFHAELSQTIALHARGSGQGRTLPPVPNTLVERARWLGDPPMDDLLVESVIDGPLYDFVRLLLDDLASEPFNGPHRDAGWKLIEQAVEHPTLLVLVLWHVNRHPILLADLIVHSKTAPLAAWLVVTRREDNPGGWARKSYEEDERSGKIAIFSDCAETLARQLAAAKPPQNGASEIADLMAALHRPTRREVVQNLVAPSPYLPILREALQGQAAETLSAMLNHLIQALVVPGSAPWILDAALDLLSIGPAAVLDDASALIRAYALALKPDDLTISTRRLTPRACAALDQASKADKATRALFLKPLDLKALMHGRSQSPLWLESQAARALRAHIRVLCRAIAGVPKPASPDLIKALQQAIDSGRDYNPVLGRIRAFSPHLETSSPFGPDDQPLAKDLSMVLNVLAPPDRDDILAAILRVEEPYVLAQLSTLVPPGQKSPIIKRIEQIEPDAIGEEGFDGDHARIEALVSAGLATQAEDFLNHSKAGRRRSRSATLLQDFKVEVRLAWVRRDPTALAALRPPEGLKPFEVNEAEDSLSFHKALLAYDQPNKAEMGEAERLFGNLARQRPHIPVYRLNHLASRISLLLGTDLFERLGEESVGEARALIDESKALDDVVGPSVRETMVENLALLQLAVGEAGDAIQTLDRNDAIASSPRQLAYRAVAMNRLGNGRQALAMIEAGRQTHASDPALAAALEHINTNARYDAAATFIFNEDQIGPVKAALNDFRVSGVERQAKILGRRTSGELVRDYLSHGAASLVGLRSALRYFGLPNWEDNVSVILRELLQTRVHDLGWQVGDQSKGGFSAAGNMGERDLTIRYATTDVAVVEAIVCRAPVTNSAQVQLLRGHFQKLVGYSTCRVFAHLTYAIVPDIGSIVTTLEDIARSHAPPRFTYQGHQRLPLEGNQPPGFIARYLRDEEEVEVTFMVLDLNQEIQKTAAAIAGGKPTAKGAPRKPPGAVKKPSPKERATKKV
ncbi:hypothetical protein [Caulobacter sp. 602-1]|uniref:hypothetical protein n=1 Tax=Caulobacter sp. 602-1 TaxID=2492472 RepID=UPI000F63F349|nr:hypothetical protein [Caulobacter sp. 602-1]RRN63828.1 hypothetical protein EIK80_13735 [Caulobacter sp. 602-1]